MLNLLARTRPDSDSNSINPPDSYEGPSTPTHPTIAKSSVTLSAGASAAIAVIFVVFMLSLTLTVCYCVRRSKRRSQEAEHNKELEIGSTIEDDESTMGIVKGEVKKPARAWVPWRR